jgi:hypothetical protein
MDVVVAVFVRAALKHLTRRIAAGRLPLPEHAVLVEDFHACIRDGSRARVRAPHLGGDDARDAGRGGPPRARCCRPCWRGLGRAYPGRARRISTWWSG